MLGLPDELDDIGRNLVDFSCQNFCFLLFYLYICLQKYLISKYIEIFMNTEALTDKR